MGLPAPLSWPDTLEGMRAHLHARLDALVEPATLDVYAEIAVRINQLKREKNAIILGHNYMEPALYHSVPDYVGDSLGLARIAAATTADLVVFCGVGFMAETAKILNPSRKVLIPADKAGCSLAAGITAQDVRTLRARHPGAPVVTYVNTYADVKALSDYCCTSGNAGAVVKHLLAEGHTRVIFAPDQYLAKNTADELGLGFVLSTPGCEAVERAIPGPALIGWSARCEVHERFTVDDIARVRRDFPDVTVLAHPECSPEVVAASDYAGSTSQMIDFVRRQARPRYLLLTECAMGDNIAAENPGRELLRLCSLRCPHMALITLPDTLTCLELERYECTLAPELIEAARLPIERMIAIG